MFQSDQAIQLARRMHTLKLRTNRSYEALGNRMGVSSSTLHRYCRGETVPASYEMIARFGRICGASKEEAEELLRCWVLTVNGHHHTDTPVPTKPTATKSRHMPGRWLAMITIAGVLGAVMLRHRVTRE